MRKGSSFTLHLSPLVWFTPVVLIVLYLVRRRSAAQIVAAGLAVFLMWTSASGFYEDDLIYWSPYYKVAYAPAPRDHSKQRQVVSLGERQERGDQVADAVVLEDHQRLPPGE